MIHKEGKWSLLLFCFILLLGIVVLSISPYRVIGNSLITFGSFFILFFLQFFRNPKRNLTNIMNAKSIYAPADGKIVVIEKIYESEYFMEDRIQVSIFMSPLNVHVNRSPFDGIVKYRKYHKGKFLMAFNPKSSLENERCTTVFENSYRDQVLYRQVAGFLARRIVNYVSEKDEVIAGKDFGFIKLGSRVDIYLPLDAKINVELNQKVKGNIDLLAEFS